MRRFCILMIFAFLLFSKMNSQQVEWAELISGYDFELSSVIDTDNDGNIIVVGYYLSDTVYFNNEIKLVKDWNDRYFIAKYSPEGKCLWADKIKLSTNNGIDLFLACDNENNFYLSNRFVSDGMKFSNGVELKGKGSDDIFIAKFDTDGKLLWAKTMGSKYGDNPTNLIVDKTGNAIIAGDYRSDTLFMEKEKYVKNGEYGNFIAKYNKDGELLFVKNFNSAIENDSTNSIYISDVKTDVDNNLNVIISYTKSIALEDDITFEAKSDVNKRIMVRYDEKGKLIWARPFDFTKLVSNDVVGISDFDLDDFGNLYFVGNLSKGKITLDNGFEIDAGINGASFITKHDKEGKCIWAETISGSDGLQLPKLKTHKNKCFVYGKIQEGKKYNSRNEEIIGLEKRGLFIIQTEAISNISNAFGIPAATWIVPTSFCIDNNEKLIISGDFTDSISFGGDYNFNVGFNLEIYIAKYDIIKTDVTEYPYKNELVLFQNPASNNITIQTPDDLMNSDVSKIQIFDILGIDVMTELINPRNASHQINIEKLPQGMYFIRIGNYSEKFMVVR